MGELGVGVNGESGYISLVLLITNVNLLYVAHSVEGRVTLSDLVVSCSCSSVAHLWLNVGEPFRNTRTLLLPRFVLDKWWLGGQTDLGR